MLLINVYIVIEKRCIYDAYTFLFNPIPVGRDERGDGEGGGDGGGKVTPS